MKHDINLFTDHYGKDDNEPGDLLNIIYHGATFGHFLQFFIEKFSKLTPDIDGDPFTDIGTSHGWLGKKKLSQRYRPTTRNSYKTTLKPRTCRYA